jgi:hypothetical protein
MFVGINFLIWGQHNPTVNKFQGAFLWNEYDKQTITYHTAHIFLMINAWEGEGEIKNC